MDENAKCVSVNNNQELNAILKAKDRVIALFYASWCPFCARFLPIYKRHAEKEGRNFVMVQDDEETIADKYSVDAFPTVIFFEDGAISKRLDSILGVGLIEIQLTKFVDSCPLPSDGSMGGR